MKMYNFLAQSNESIQKTRLDFYLGKGDKLITLLLYSVLVNLQR